MLWQRRLICSLKSGGRASLFSGYRHITCFDRAYSFAVGHLEHVDLNAEYNKTISRIVLENRDILTKEIPNKISDEPVEDFEEDDRWIDQALRTEDEQIVASTVLRARRVINSEYNEVKRIRSIHPKSSPPVALYDKFLRWLYPLNSGDFQSAKYFDNVFASYNDLPMSPVKFMTSTHLEDLIALFMSPRCKNPHYLVSVLCDIIDCNLPISSREQSIALFKLGKALGTDLQSWQPLQERYLRMSRRNESLENLNDHNSSVLTLRNTSNFNTLLSVAFASQNPEMISQIIVQFKNSDLQPDRNTVASYMLYESIIARNPSAVSKLYKEMTSGAFVIDISMMNLTFKCLLGCGLQQPAEVMLESIMKYKIATPVLSRSSPFVWSLLRKVELMDYFLSIIRQSVPNASYSLPIIPDMFTYNEFISHYCDTNQEQKCLNMLGTMMSQGVVPDRFVFYQIFKTYAARSNWTIEGLKYLTETVCNIQGMSQDAHLVSRSMAICALKAYTAKLPASKIPALALLEEEFKNRNYPLHYNVYRLLIRLSEL